MMMMVVMVVVVAAAVNIEVYTGLVFVQYVLTRW